jgi:GTP-binding protein HflX
MSSTPATDFEVQMKVTEAVLSEIGALLRRRRAELSERNPDAIQVFAKDPDDIARVHQLILKDFERLLGDLNLVVPYARSGLIGDVHKLARVLAEDFKEDGLHYQLKVSASDAVRLKRSLEGTGDLAAS